MPTIVFTHQIAVRLASSIVLLLALAACSEDEDSAPPEQSLSKAGGGGAAGKAAGGAANNAGTAGSPASGAGGDEQAGAAGGPGGTAGSGGSDSGGNGGSSTAGASGEGGTGGTDAGASGTAGASTAGAGGDAGSGGDAGAGGGAGSGDAGNGGAGLGGGAGANGGAAGTGAECSDDTKLCGGVCVNLDTPKTGCGALDSCAPCALPHAQAGCSAGVCVIAACDTGFDDCDGDATNGCETPTNDDLNNCGQCGKTCDAPNGTSACEAGKCVVSACNNGFADCDNLASNGCEANTQGDTSNCGGCGKVCTAANGSPACTNATCTIGSCNAGFADCNQSAVDGCEVNTQSSVNNCGACGQVCKLAHASATCNSGFCEIAQCDTIYKDCDGEADNGCEWKGICP